MTETADAAPSHARHSTRHAPQRHGPGALSLGDFTADRRMLMLVAMATLVGAAGAAGAWVLLRLIALVSNLVWLGKLGVSPVDFAQVRPSPWMVLAPALGGLAVGLMARYGSEKIRGHGIPEAIEAILIGALPHVGQGGAAEAAVVGDRHRHRRPVRGRGADHHDRRRDRLAVRAAVPPQRRRAQDAAGGRRGGRHDRRVRHAAGRRAAGGRAAAVRVEAAQLPAGDGGGAGRRRGAAVPAGRRAAVPPGRPTWGPSPDPAAAARGWGSSPGCSRAC